MEEPFALLFGLIALAIFGAIYFIPTIVSVQRGHRNSAAIFMLNALLGWTFLGWVVALVWAFTSNVAPLLRSPAVAPEGELLSVSREALELIEKHAQAPAHKVLAERLRKAIANAKSAGWAADESNR